MHWLLLVSLLAAPAPARVLKAGSFTLHTTPGRGTATDGHETLVLWDEAELKGCDEPSYSGRVVSVVGTWVSMELELGGDCHGAHPMAAHHYRTVDVAKHGAEVKLEALVPAAVIDAALLRDPYVKKLLLAQGKTRVDELDSCELWLDGVKGAGFAFLEAGDGTVGVRVAPGHGYEVCRGAFVVLGLTLKAPDALVQQVKSAAAAKTLLRDLVTR